MGLVELILVVLLILFLAGGLGYRAPADGGATINTVLYILVVVVVVILVVRLLGVL